MKAVTKEERRVAYPLVLSFAILALGIVVGGTVYYQHYQRQFRTEVERQLSAIAELKAGELAQYRKERLKDAGIFLNNDSFSVLVKRFLTNPEDVDAQRQIQEWAAKFVATGQYDHVRLLDAQGVTRLSSPVGLPQVTFVSQNIHQILGSDQVTFRDLHLNENDHRAYLNIMVPIFEEQDVSRPLGVFYLRIDPAKYLYPLIQRWPVPSETTEILLIRRDGNDALFLNELKFETNTALNLRVSLENTNVPAVKAALGQEGIVEGVDYRGEPVLAALRAIPDSPWFLVAKVDTAEVYAPLRERLRLTILLVSLLLIGAGFGMGMFWRHQRVRFYKEHYKMTKELRESEERLRSHTDNSPMAVIEWNADLIITRWTGTAEKMFGWSAEEAIGKPIAELPKIYEEDLPSVQNVIRQLTDGVSKNVFSSNRNRTRNGRVIHCEWYNSVLRDAGGKMISVLSQVLDITEQKQAEEVLRQAHGELEKRVSERTAELAQERRLLRILIDNLPDGIYTKDTAGRKTMANPADLKNIRCKTEAEAIGKSDFDHYPKDIAEKFLADDQKVIQGQPVLNREEYFLDEEGRKRWLLTSKLPLRDQDGKIIGLMGIGRDITERKQAEEALRQSHDELEKRVAERTAELSARNAELARSSEALASTHRLLQAMLDNIPDRIYFKDTQSRFIMASRSLAGRLGVADPEETVGKTDFDFQLPEQAKEFYADEQRIMQTGEALLNKTEKQIMPNGEITWTSTTKVPLWDSAGKVVGLAGINRDITEIKQAEEALRESQALYFSLAEQLPVGVFRKDPAGRYVLVNPGFCRLKGMKAEEFLGKTPKEVAASETAKGDRTGLAIKYAAADWNHHEQIIKTGKPIEMVEEFTDINGRKLFVQAMKSPVFGLGGKIIGTQGILIDITEIKRAEEELHQSNEALAKTHRLLQAMLDNAPDRIYFKDTQSRFIMASRSWARRFDLANPEDAVGKTDFDFQLPERAREFYADEQRIMQTGEALINKTEKQIMPNGKITWTSTTKVPLRDSAGKVVGLAGINRDITEQKQAEEALRSNQDRMLKVITQTRCILNSGQVEGPEGWRERALNQESPFRWDFPVQNEEAAQKILPLELAPGEKYQQAWTRSRNHADHAQMNWNSGNAFLNDLPFYRNEFRCIDKHGVGHWMQQFVTVRKLAENHWEVFGITTDISDLKRIETELRESQALYHSLVDQMPAGVFRKDAQGHYVLVNSAFCKLQETTADQYLGKTALELKVGDVALATRGAGHHATIMQSGNKIEDDEVFTRLNGETRNYHAVKTPVFDSAGKIVGTQGVLFDITERKQAEQDREQAFQRQRGISWLHENLLASRPLRDKLQLVTETIVRLFDADFCRIWLARPGDLCEQGCMHALVTEGPHACRRRDICLHLLASAGRYTHLDGTKHGRVPYGAYKIGRIASGKEAKFLINDVQQNPQVHDREWAKELGLVSFAGYRLQSPGGTPLGVLALFAKRPLTAQEDVLLEALSNATTSVLLTHLAEDESRRELAERKRAEEALHWNETQLHVILESTADGILAVDNKGKVIKTNRRFAELWRIPQSLMDARDDRALLDFVLEQLSDPDAFLKKERSLYGTDAVDMDTLAFKDGRIFERYYFPMMMDGAVIGWVWSFRDITGRKRQEKELSEKNTELERFTYTVSHDLKSPLVTVKTFLGYLEQDLAGPDKERVKQDVAYMHTAADKMGQLLDELLNLARVGHKMNPAERVTFKELAQEAVRLIAGRISTGGAEVQVADAAVVLEGDRPRLMEIWQNLVENACKFMGNQPKPRVEIGVEKRGSETVFFVRDNGAGIDPRYQAKVFGLFEKLDPKGEGTGMGLALVKRIVEMYKGRIWVESPGLGQGANFLFTLPEAVIIDPEQSS
ncbi:MAG: PAS domain S-box protein [Verrucomicrobiota bacterium]|jgi:PAS domain S-box-containing protein